MKKKQECNTVLITLKPGLLVLIMMICCAVGVMLGQLMGMEKYNTLSARIGVQDETIADIGSDIDLLVALKGEVATLQKKLKNTQYTVYSLKETVACLSRQVDLLRVTITGGEDNGCVKKK